MNRRAKQKSKQPAPAAKIAPQYSFKWQPNGGFELKLLPAGTSRVVIDIKDAIRMLEIVSQVKFCADTIRQLRNAGLLADAVFLDKITRLIRFPESKGGLAS